MRWFRNLFRRRTEAWKAYALALEVLNECEVELHTDPYGEGCLTRAKRRHKIQGQRANAEDALCVALDTLITLGEYDV